MKELKILVCNVHGIRQRRGQEDRMLEVVEEAKRQKRQVVVLTETHFDVDDSSRFAEIAEKSGFATFSVTRVMKRFDSGSGGVTIMVDLNIRAKEVKRSTQEDLIWVCLEIGKEKLYVGGVYLVPNTSSRANKTKPTRRTRTRSSLVQIGRSSTSRGRLELQSWATGFRDRRQDMD